MRRGRKLLSWAVLGVALIAPARASAQYVFYTETSYSSPALHRCAPNGTGLATRALTAGTLPEGVAFDGAANRLYWVEAAWFGARIRASDGGLGAGTTILSGLGSVRGIAVDHAGGWIYWTSSDQTTQARVSRAHLDGSGAQILLLMPGLDPRQIAIDKLHGKLYWTEFEADEIMRCNLDGSAAEVVALLAHGSRPYGIAVNPPANGVWWTEYGTGSVQAITLLPAPANVETSAPPPGEGGLEARSSALMAAVRARAPALPATAVASGLSNPTHLVLDVPGRQFFVTTAGVGHTTVTRANLDGTGLAALPVPQNTFGGIDWYGSTLLGVGGGPQPPAPVALALSAENPARGAAAIAFALPGESDVRLSVLDAAGRRVAIVAEGRHAAGWHHLSWLGETVAGTAAPGMYVLRLEAAGRTLTRRLAWLR